MRRPVRFILGLLTAAVLAAPTRGQHRVEVSDGPAFTCWLPSPEADHNGAGGAHGSRPVSPVFSRSGGEPAAQFEVTYEGFSAEAQAAFQAAVDVWAQHVSSPVPIRIRARWTELSPNLLGSAGPFLIRGFSVPFGTPVIPNTWYPYPLADALAGQDLRPPPAGNPAGNPDIEASFNCAFSRWYFGTDGQVPPNQIELFTVVLHELGHGLGFIGSLDVENGRGVVGAESSGGQEDGIPFIYDRFAEDRQGESLLDAASYSPPSEALAEVLTDAVFFSSSTVEDTYGEPAPLYAPAVWNPGSSYSHLDEATFPATSADGLMTPNIASGEHQDDPGPLLCAALQDLGWTLAPACVELVQNGSLSSPTPALGLPVVHSSGHDPFRGEARLNQQDPLLHRGDGGCAPAVDEPYVLEGATPNPFRDLTDLTLTVQAPQRVQVWLVDAVGRRVASLLDTSMSGGESVVLTVEGTVLPSGVYFVHIVGETFEATTAVTRIR
jgi:hypothetical protein